mmetsp:Transcript_51360/g.85332  ORF Transcript_51360/g.85332 Transcript_51360/m.85332 type:complete len:530 (+) Transcript_51360:255-1844(+)
MWASCMTPIDKDPFATVGLFTKSAGSHLHDSSIASSLRQPSPIPYSPSAPLPYPYDSDSGSDGEADDAFRTLSPLGGSCLFHINDEEEEEQNHTESPRRPGLISVHSSLPLSISTPASVHPPQIQSLHMPSFDSGFLNVNPPQSQIHHSSSFDSGFSNVNPPQIQTSHTSSFVSGFSWSSITEMHQLVDEAGAFENFLDPSPAVSSPVSLNLPSPSSVGSLAPSPEVSNNVSQIEPPIIPSSSFCTPLSGFVIMKTETVMSPFDNNETMCFDTPRMSSERFSSNSPSKNSPQSPSSSANSPFSVSSPSKRVERRCRPNSSYMRQRWETASSCGNTLLPNESSHVQQQQFSSQLQRTSNPYARPTYTPLHRSSSHGRYHHVYPRPPEHSLSRRSQSSFEEEDEDYCPSPRPATRSTGVIFDVPPLASEEDEEDEDEDFEAPTGSSDGASSSSTLLRKPLMKFKDRSHAARALVRAHPVYCSNRERYLKGTTSKNLPSGRWIEIAEELGIDLSRHVRAKCSTNLRGRARIF